MTTQPITGQTPSEEKLSNKEFAEIMVTMNRLFKDNITSENGGLEFDTMPMFRWIEETYILPNKALQAQCSTLQSENEFLSGKRAKGNTVLVPADKLKEMQDRLATLQREKAEAFDKGFQAGTEAGVNDILSHR